MAAPSEGWAVWVVGLPGSGKSALSRGLARELNERGMDVVHLQMDARRKTYFKNPTYSAEEREEAYRLFAEEAAAYVREGRGVVMDGAAYKAAFRDYARSLIPRFAEVRVKCRLETAMAREAKRPEGLVMAGLYEKALKRQRTGEQFPGLGEVIGVDVPFEESPRAEFSITNDDIPKQETRSRTLAWFDAWLAESGGDGNDT